MKFVYKNKDSYSQTELDEILEQHKGFVSKGFKGFVAPEDYKKLEDELTPFKTKARTSHISSLVGEMTSEDKISDAIALSKITEEDDDEAIKAKVKATIAGRKYLQKDAGVAPELKNKTVTKTKKESAKKRRFVKGDQ